MFLLNWVSVHNCKYECACNCIVFFLFHSAHIAQYNSILQTNIVFWIHLLNLESHVEVDSSIYTQFEHIIIKQQVNTRKKKQYNTYRFTHTCAQNVTRRKIVAKMKRKTKKNTCKMVGFMSVFAEVHSLHLDYFSVVFSFIISTMYLLVQWF